MAIILRKKEILSALSKIDVVAEMEKGFIEYSSGNTVVPPVTDLLFDDPKGETHIKCGYIKGDDFFVIKVASGFYNNPKMGIASSQGLMLLFNQKTGEVEGVLLDDGHLTDIRTAAAGALAAKYFAPKHITGIGIVGAGIQARLQLQYLQKITPCNKVWLWNRNDAKTKSFLKALGSEYDIQIATNTTELASNCNLIVTTTPSEVPLLNSIDIQPGTHITAVGSDTPAKQELESNIIANADIIVADSLYQSKSRGEIFRAIKDGEINKTKIIELGTAIINKSLQRTSEDQITVVDLTGVAVQDIMIAKAVYAHFLNNKKTDLDYG